MRHTAYIHITCIVCSLFALPALSQHINNPAKIDKIKVAPSIPSIPKLSETIQLPTIDLNINLEDLDQIIETSFIIKMDSLQVAMDQLDINIEPLEIELNNLTDALSTLLTELPELDQNLESLNSEIEDLDIDPTIIRWDEVTDVESLENQPEKDQQKDKLKNKSPKTKSKEKEKDKAKGLKKIN